MERSNPIADFLSSGKTLVIAEVGSNHAGDHELAVESVAAAKAAGADAVKFQLFRAETLVDDKFPLLKHVRGHERTQRERFRVNALPPALIGRLAEAAAKAGLLFLVTPFDEEAVELLDPYVPAFKIASGDLTNRPLVERVIAKDKPILISTGLSTLEEIDAAAGIIPRHHFHPMHCVAAYPTPDEQAGLNAIPFLARHFGCPVGYSDHTIGGLASAIAVGLGANIVEKHFLPRENPNVGDYALSLGVDAFRAMVEDIRRVEKMRGVFDKIVQPAEADYFQMALRRSLYAKVDIPADVPIKEDWLIALRPWSKDAAAPASLQEIIGRRLKTPVAAGLQIQKANIA